MKSNRRSRFYHIEPLQAQKIFSLICVRGIDAFRQYVRMHSTAPVISSGSQLRDENSDPSVGPLVSVRDVLFYLCVKKKREKKNFVKLTNFLPIAPRDRVNITENSSRALASI